MHIELLHIVKLFKQELEKKNPFLFHVAKKKVRILLFLELKFAE